MAKRHWRLAFTNWKQKKKRAENGIVTAVWTNDRRNDGGQVITWQRERLYYSNNIYQKSMISESNGLGYTCEKVKTCTAIQSIDPRPNPKYSLSKYTYCYPLLWNYIYIHGIDINDLPALKSKKKKKKIRKKRNAIDCVYFTLSTASFNLIYSQSLPCNIQRGVM